MVDPWPRRASVDSTCGSFRRTLAASARSTVASVPRLLDARLAREVANCSASQDSSSPRSSPDTADSAPYVPKCRVVDDTFDWGGVRSPNVPWRDTIIYELHVKAFFDSDGNGNGNVNANADANGNVYADPNANGRNWQLCVG